MVKSILSKVFHFENKNNPNILAKTIFTVFNDRLEEKFCDEITHTQDCNMQIIKLTVINSAQFLKRHCL
ncbi:hypothetical protein L3V83_13760 [Thiotrichales bacterium 19X7-9]|nr:hypothetical protein [Thiotrichales bacterium 19X7-9]